MANRQRHLGFKTWLAAIALSTTAWANANTVVQVRTDYASYRTSEGYAEDVDQVLDDLANADSAAVDAWHIYHWTPRELVIADVGATIYADGDHDGYYSKFTLGFDVDVGYGEAWVYAVIDIRRSGQEYAIFHTTEVFEIQGNLSSDRYQIAGSLVSNYPAGHYDFRITVFDSAGELRPDSIDARTHRTLAALPLESGGLDDAYGYPDVIVREYAGAVGIVPLMCGLLLVLRRRGRGGRFVWGSVTARVTALQRRVSSVHYNNAVNPILNRTAAQWQTRSKRLTDAPLTTRLASGARPRTPRRGISRRPES